MGDCIPADPTANGPRPAPGSEEKLDRLRNLLREMFQLDRGDLDFGLYRIMNMKAGEITAFLDNDLLPQAQGMLKGISAEDRAKLDEELGETLATLTKLGVSNPEDTGSVKDLRRQIADARADAEAEADVYGHLANFFARYYSEGDFMSQRRYSGGAGPAYLIPYDGEEVKLHWANADQYYVKTTETDDGKLRLLRLHHRQREEARPVRDRSRRQREGQRQGTRRQAAPFPPGEDEAGDG